MDPVTAAVPAPAAGAGPLVITREGSEAAAALFGPQNAAQRFAVYPIQHHDLWLLYKQQLAAFWTAEEIDFSRDREQWNTLLNDDERHFLRCVLAFFASADTLVSLNLTENFCKEVPILEAQIAYTYQAMMENIHAEAYSMQIEALIQDDDEKTALFESVGGVLSVERKVEWARRWGLDRDGSASLPLRLVAFAIVEGVFFSGCFCAIYWIKQRNLLPGLTKSNEFIARDEGQHTKFGCALYAKLRREARLPQEDVHALFREAVAIEKEFICEAIPCRLVGMNSDLMSRYIEYVADGILRMLGCDPLYGSDNPFDFMEMCGVASRVNFFECRPSEYQRADVLNRDNADGQRNVLYDDADF